MDSDLALIQAIANGDRRALETLYERYGLVLLNHIIGLIGDRAIADEVLQDVMLAVWQGAGRFRSESKVSTWLFSIARRQTFNRQRATRPPTTELDEEHVIFAPEHADYDDLLAAIEELPASQQEALDLIYYRGFSSVEAAELLNISVNTFRSRLQRARVTLRRRLGVQQ